MEQLLEARGSLLDQGSPRWQYQEQCPAVEKVKNTDKCKHWQIRTYRNKFVQEYSTKIGAGSCIQRQDTTCTIGRELDACQETLSCQFLINQLETNVSVYKILCFLYTYYNQVTVLGVYEKTCAICSQNLRSDVSSGQEGLNYMGARK
jgi:hypothetical protein